MADNDPTFNGWPFSSVDLVVSSISSTLVYPARPAKAAMPDQGISSEATLAGRSFRMGGKITAASESDLSTKWGTLLKRTRGAGDRTKKGQLDVTGTGHFLAQAVGSWGFAKDKGQSNAVVSLEFYADDPWLRKTLRTVSETLSGGDKIIALIFASSFTGDAPRMPAILNLGGGWQKDELLRVNNSVTGEWFEHVVSRNLTASEDLVVDGEAFEVLEGSQVAMSGTSGTFPYVRGGVTQNLDFEGSSRLQGYDVIFWDRFYG